MAITWSYKVREHDDDFSEEWVGNFATREEAIAAARKLLVHPEATAKVCSFRVPDPTEFAPDVDEILDRMTENADTECGTDGEWPDVSAAAKAELDAFVMGWVRRHCRVDFKVADGKAEKVERVAVAAGAEA